MTMMKTKSVSGISILATRFVALLCALSTAVPIPLVAYADKAKPAAAPSGLDLLGIHVKQSQAWVVTPRREKKTENGITFRSQLFQRFVDFGQFQAPVATVSYTEIEKQPNDKTTADEYASILRKAMKLPPWEHRTYGKAQVFEVNWVKGNRLIQLFYKDDGKFVHVSLSTVRRLYSIPVSFETELLQRALVDEGQNTASASKTLFQWFAWVGAWIGPTEAFAQVAGSPGGLTGSQLYQGANNVLTTAQGDVKQGLQIGRQANRNWANTNQQLNTANQNWANTNGQLGGINQTGQSIAGQVGGLTNSINNANNTLTDMMSWQNVALTAAAGTVGGVVAGMVVNFVADGISDGISSLWYAIVGRMNPRERDEQRKIGMDGMADIDKLSKEVVAAEKLVDMEMATLAFAVNHPAEDLAEVGRRQGIRATALHKLTERGYETALMNGNDAAINYCEMKADEFGQQQKFYDLINPILGMASKNGKSSEDVQAKVCDDLFWLFGKWLSMESQIDNARQAVMNNAEMVLGDTVDKMAKTHDRAFNRKARGEYDHSVGKLEDVNEQGGQSIDGQRQVGDRVKEFQANRNRRQELSFGNKVNLNDLNFKQKMLVKLAQGYCDGPDDKFCSKTGDFVRLAQKNKARMRVAAQACPDIQGLLDGNQIPDGDGDQMLANDGSGFQGYQQGTNRSQASYQPNPQPSSTGRGFFGTVWHWFGYLWPGNW